MACGALSKTCLKQCTPRTLAAPQIGIVRQIVVIDDREGGKFALINPVITKEEGEQESCEGCLSLPGYRGTVKRPQKVAVEALDTDGNKVALEAESYLVRRGIFGSRFLPRD